MYKLIDKDYEFKSNFSNYVSEDYSGFMLAVLVMMLNMILWAHAVYITGSVKQNGFQTSLHFGISNFIFSSVMCTLLTKKFDINVFY